MRGGSAVSLQRPWEVSEVLSIALHHWGITSDRVERSRPPGLTLMSVPHLRVARSGTQSHRTYVEIRKFPFLKAILVFNAICFQAAPENWECDNERTLGNNKERISFAASQCHRYALSMKSPWFWSFQSYFYSSPKKSILLGCIRHYKYVSICIDTPDSCAGSKTSPCCLTWPAWWMLAFFLHLSP